MKSAWESSAQGGQSEAIGEAFGHPMKAEGLQEVEGVFVEHGRVLCGDGHGGGCH